MRMIALNSNELLVSIKLSNEVSSISCGITVKIFGAFDPKYLGSTSWVSELLVNKDRSMDCSYADLSNDNLSNDADCSISSLLLQ